MSSFPKTPVRTYRLVDERTVETLLALTVEQGRSVQALRNALHELGQSAGTITQTMEAAIEQIQIGRCIRGRIIDFDRAPYRQVSTNVPSFYVRLSTRSGVIMPWGIGLHLALRQAHARVNDMVVLTYEWRQSIIDDTPVRRASDTVLTDRQTVAMCGCWRVENVSASSALTPAVTAPTSVRFAKPRKKHPS